MTFRLDDRKRGRCDFVPLDRVKYTNGIGEVVIATVLHVYNGLVDVECISAGGSPLLSKPRHTFEWYQVEHV